MPMSSQKVKDDMSKIDDDMMEAVLNYTSSPSLQHIKLVYQEEVYKRILMMFGLMDKDGKYIKNAASRMVEGMVKEDKKYCLAFFICPMYVKNLKDLLLDSYLHYFNDTKKSQVKRVIDQNLVVMEYLDGNLIPYHKEGIKAVAAKEVLKEKTMKFDMIVTNPPYDGSLHLDIFAQLLKCVKEGGQMSIVEPSTWLINVRRNGKAKLYDEIKHRIEGHVKSIVIENLDKEFDIGNNTPLSITQIDFSKHYDTIDFECCGEKKVIKSIYDANLVGSYNVIWSILNKVKDGFADKMENHIAKKDETYPHKKFIKYHEIVSALMGSYGSSAESMMDLPCFMAESPIGKYPISFFAVGYSQTDPTMYDTIPFAKKRGASKELSTHHADCVYGTREELENWKHFIFNNKLPLFINIVLTIDQNNNSTKFLPWLVDKKYTDEEINKMFNFTEEEIKLIDDTLKKFERNSPWFKRYMCGKSAE